MGGCYERNLQEDHGVNGRVEGEKSSGRPRQNGWVLRGKSSGRPRHRRVGVKREIFRKTAA
jgi:hypothetical protein